MIDFKPGDKVCYIPFNGCDKSLYENGIIKTLNSLDKNSVFVVYHCNNDWDNYWNYTAANTDINRLRSGWTE